MITFTTLFSLLNIISDIDLLSMVAGMSIGKSDDSSSIYSDSAYGTGSIISSTYAQVSQYRQVRYNHDQFMTTNYAFCNVGYII